LYGDEPRRHTVIRDAHKKQAFRYKNRTSAMFTLPRRGKIIVKIVLFVINPCRGSIKVDDKITFN